MLDVEYLQADPKPTLAGIGALLDAARVRIEQVVTGIPKYLLDEKLEG